MKVYECVIVGGGPAGLSAAIYLARFNRTTLVIDKHDGRSSFAQTNENYLGFPEGIKARELRTLGKNQAKKFGAEFADDEIIDITKEHGEFICTGNNGIYGAKTIILATGVTDLFPHFDFWKEYVGKSMFWCITCDGHKVLNKKIAVIGQNNDAACTCMQFLNYTKNIVFITNIKKGKEEIDSIWFHRFAEAKIPCYQQSIAQVNGNDGYVESILLEDGTRVDVEMIFNEQGSIANYELAKKLGVELDETLCIKVDSEQRTNIPCVYAAGDVTNLHSHQIGTAVHEGSMAAQAANYDLYAPFQQI